MLRSDCWSRKQLREPLQDCNCAMRLRMARSVSLQISANLVRLTAGAGGPTLGGNNLREGVHEKYAENDATGCHQLFVYDRGRVIASGAGAEEACGPGATTDAGTVAGHARREAVAQHCAAPAQSGRLGSGAPAQRSGTPLRAYPLAVQQEPASAG